MAVIERPYVFRTTPCDIAEFRFSITDLECVFSNQPPGDGFREDKTPSNRILRPSSFFCSPAIGTPVRSDHGPGSPQGPHDLRSWTGRSPTIGLRGPTRATGKRRPERLANESVKGSAGGSRKGEPRLARRLIWRGRKLSSVADELPDEALPRWTPERTDQGRGPSAWALGERLVLGAIGPGSLRHHVGHPAGRAALELAGAILSGRDRLPAGALVRDRHDRIPSRPA